MGSGTSQKDRGGWTVRPSGALRMRTTSCHQEGWEQIAVKYSPTPPSHSLRIYFYREGKCPSTFHSFPLLQI